MLQTLHGLNADALDADGAILSTGDDSSDLLGNAWCDHVDLLVIPAVRLSPEFFDLSTGGGGEFLRKSTNYGIRIAILGDVSGYASRSDAFDAFDAFVWEANRGAQVWFVADLAELERRLAPK